MTAPRHIDAYIDDIYTCVRSRCGFCMPGCPAFLARGFETYTSRGKCLIIKAMLEGTLPPSHEVAEALSCCTACGFCTTNCDVDRPVIFQAMRRDLREAGFGVAALERVCDAIRRYNSPYGPPGEGCYEELLEQSDPSSPILFYPGCTSTQRERRLAHATARILGRYAMLPRQLCCGSVAHKAGDTPLALEQGKALADALAPFETVVTACAGCYGMLAVTLPSLGVEVAPSIRHISQYLAERMHRGELRLSQIGTGTVATYHDPCHLGRHAGEYEAPREVLAAMGFSIAEMARTRERALCCGAGGGMKAAHGGTAAAIAALRIREARATGAHILVTACPFCERNLRDGAAEAGEDIPVVDLVELAAQALVGIRGPHPKENLK
ncbi:MAG: (Fe-S)-binding protein [Candidatus Methanofastidiosa archaeon]|nr:(Fe-S)-binding protein [Candidatus Methanofastidiosa archaeon]